MSTPESQFDFSTVARAAPPSTTAPSSTPAPAYDFSSVAREAPATRKPRPSSSVVSGAPAPVASTWSLATGAPKVKGWYKQNFNVDLPVTSFGQDSYHDSLNLDHRNSFDVPLSPSSKEGQALVSYLTTEGIPFRPITAEDVARGVKASGPHIHVGPQSHALGSQPTYDFSSVARDAPYDFSSVAQGAPDDDVISINARKPDAPAPPAPRTLSPLPERTSFNAQTEEGRQGRDARDLKEWGSNAKLSLDVPLPSGAQDWSQVSSEDASRQAARTFAASRGIPADFVAKWLDKNKHLNLHLYDSATGEKKEPSDYIYEGSPAYDFEKRTLRVSADMPHLKQLEQDYQQSRGVAGGLSDLATDDTLSPFEKLKAVTWDSPQGRETRAGADYMRRGLRAADVGGWAYALGQGGGAAAQSALAFQDIPTPYDNPAGDMWKAGVEAAAPYVGPVVGAASGNAAIGKLAGAAIEPEMRGSARTGQAVLGVVAQPLNIVPLGEVSALADAGKLGRAVEESGELSARVAKLLHPLGLEAPEHAAEQSLDVILRGADGTHYLVNTGTNEIVDLSTGEMVELPRSPHDELREAGYKVESIDPPNASAEDALYNRAVETVRGANRGSAAVLQRELRLPQDEAEGLLSRMEREGVLGPYVPGKPREVLPVGEAPKVWKVTDSDGHVQIMRDDAELSDFADSVNEHHSARQPRDESGRFDGPPQPSKWSVRSRAIIEGGNPDEAVAAARASGQLPPAVEAVAPKKSLLRRVAGTAADVVQLPKIKAGFDFSATARQGLAQALAHPSYFKEAFAEQVKAFASQDAYNAFLESIKARPDFDLMQRSGLYLSGVGENVEEAFASRLVKRIPGVRGSDRAYSAALNSVRVQAWDNYMRAVAENPDTTDETYRAIAELVNISTGRGKVAILDRSELGRKVVNLLNVPFFSPRNTASKFNLVSPVRLARNMLDPATRPVAYLQLRDATQGLATLGTTLGLMHYAGLDVTVNPFSSDFGKVRVGKTVYDLTGGEAYTVRYLAQMARTAVNEARGHKAPKGAGLADLTSRYLRTQLQPAAGVVADWKTGKTVEGKPFTYSRAALDLVVPFVVDDVMKGFQEEGILGAVKATPGVLGVGVNSYDKPRRDKKGGGAPAAAPADTDANYMRLEGAPMSRNVEDRRDSGDDSAHYTAEDHRALVEERTAQGEPEIDDAQAGSIALLVDSIPEHAFSDFARSVDETKETGRAGEVVTEGAELAAKGLGYELPAQAHRAQRMLAREMRLRPVQFYFDAAAGRYGERMRSEAMEGVYYPQNHLPRH